MKKYHNYLIFLGGRHMIPPEACPVPEFEKICGRLIVSFRYAAAIESLLKRGLFFNLTAIAQNLPRSECRKLFDVWLTENLQNLNI